MAGGDAGIEPSGWAKVLTQAAGAVLVQIPLLLNEQDLSPLR